MKGPFVALSAIGAAVAAQAAYYYSRLPDPMASHFGFDGDPDGWSSRASFFAVYVAVLVLAGGVPLALALFLPRLPDRAINLPNKGHWLMAPRRAATLAYVQRQIGWSAAGVLGLVVLTTQEVLRANLAAGGRLETARLGWLLGLFVCFAAIAPIRLYLRFRNVPAS